MKWFTSFAVFVSFTVLSVSLGADATRVSGSDVEMTLVRGKESYLRGAPVDLLLTVTNKSAEVVALDFNYFSLQMQLVFYPAAVTNLQEIAKYAPRIGGVTFTPVTVSGGGSYQVVVYLDQRLLPLKLGNNPLRWLFNLGVSKVDHRGRRIPDTNLRLELNGTVNIAIRETDENSLDKEFRQAAVGLDSEDQHRNFEAVMALSSVTSPLAVKYLGRALAVPRLAPRAIDGLARFDTPESRQLIASMVPHNDLAVLQAALKQLAHKKIRVESEKIAHILASEGSGGRYAAIEYLRAVGRPDDVALLDPLLDDANQAIAKAAKECREELLRKQSRSEGGSH